MMSEGRESRRRRILVVDDEPDFLDLIDMVLSPNYTCFTTPDAAKVTAMVEELSPDLILLDLKMSEKSGASIMEELRSSKAFVPPPVIVISAYCDRDHIETARELGAVDYIRKPFDLGELLEKIEACLDTLP